MCTPRVSQMVFLIMGVNVECEILGSFVLMMAKV